MRIAFVTFEYAGVASGGGIGTYVRSAAAMMAARGHDVEVFTRGDEDALQISGGVRIHAIASDRVGFAKAAADRFAARHAGAPFDVFESAEYGADGAAVAAAFPSLASVVKLHTPTFVINQLNELYVPSWRRAKFLLGGVRRGRVSKPYWRYDPSADRERRFALGASEITAPSLAVIKLVASRWDLPAARLSHIPNPFVPTAVLLNVPPDSLTRRITYLGRLEVRKGVIELAHAIRRVVSAARDIRFRLVGRSSKHPATGEDMEVHLRRLLGPSVSAVEFVGAAPHGDVPAYLNDTDICVFPSTWEASGYVCKEAMAAARGVIATGGSGMGEIIDDGVTGRLVPPRDVGALASAMLDMLGDPAGRSAMGRAARLRLTANYSPDVIAPMQEASYRRAISRAALLR